MASREVWRRLIDFPEYEVNSRGHVRIARNKQKLIPENGLTAGVFKLWHNGDPKKVKAADLVTRYFPELQEGGQPLVWKQLKDFPDYEVSEIGIVRNINTKYELPVLRMQGYDAKVALWHEGIRGTYLLADLVKETFTEVAA